MTGSNYDKFPAIELLDLAGECQRGWAAILTQLQDAIAPLENRSRRERRIVAVECYTGVHHTEVETALREGLPQAHFLTTFAIFKTTDEINALAAPYLGGDDPIFGSIAPLTLDAFVDAAKLTAFRRNLSELEGVVVIYGTGATLCAAPDLLIYADMPRWEGQLRQRRGEVSNLGICNHSEKASLQYKRSYFLDWRVLDRLKGETIARWDYLLDTTVSDDPKLVTGAALRTALDRAAHRPFRVQPLFDPAPWGGQWMKEVCDLDPSAPNFGWCFDCVPEENSLLLQYGETRVEIPALDLILHRPSQLLGSAICRVFGAEFPIRFDFLDTMGGGNLSLQVHPLTAYIREKFGMFYTQDESYYILDASDGAGVYLGLEAGADPSAMFDAIAEAQAGGAEFDADRFAHRWPARKHDHFLIPAGTLHCSGANTMVLEISATPYIFTFKLWDWGRLGLDGLPRPINLERGRDNLQADRDALWVRDNLVNRFEPIDEGAGWREERTGLHPLEFIETRRHWFNAPVPHDTMGTVDVFCLVEGREAIVESPSGAFAPFIVHYAETVIVPASVGQYTIRPHGDGDGQTCATLKAFVRPEIDRLTESVSLQGRSEG